MEEINYTEARAAIKSGELLAWSGTGFFSSLVKLFTDSAITHVGISWKIGGRLFVIESIEGKGVRIFPLSRSLPFYWLRPLEETDNVWSTIAEEVALETVGQNYSLAGCIKAILKKPLTRDENWQCAEFASYILGLIGHPTKNCNTPDLLVKRMLDNKHELNYVSKKK